MAVIYVCDGCERQESGGKFGGKPDYWYEREDRETGRQHVCSRPCIDKVANKLGVTSTVLPI